VSVERLITVKRCERHLACPVMHLRILLVLLSVIRYVKISRLIGDKDKQDSLIDGVISPPTVHPSISIAIHRIAL
jgi:hypothetical protein